MTNQTFQITKALLRLPNGQYIAPYTDCKGALEVGDIGQAIHVDETQGLRRKLNGQVVDMNTNTQDFVNKLKAIQITNPSLFCTNTEWEAIAATNRYGQCGKFVLNETSRNAYYAWGNSSYYVFTLSDTPSVGDAIYDTAFTDTGRTVTVVETESIEITGGVGAFNRYTSADIPAFSTGTIRLPKIAFSMGCLDLTKLGELGFPDRHVVRRKTGTNWYTVYSDGFCEQGDLVTGNGGNYAVTFQVPYANTNYAITNATRYNSGTNVYATDVVSTSITANGFTQFNPHAYGSYWEARGYTTTEEVVKDQDRVTDGDTPQYPYFIQISQGQATVTSIRNDWQINNPYTLFDAKQSQYPLNNISWLQSKGQWNDKTLYTGAYEALCVELDDAIETNTTVTLPSGGKYTKHLQTLNFDASQVAKVGTPTIEYGIFYPTEGAMDSNYVQLNVGADIFNNAQRWQLDLKFQYVNRNIVNAYDGASPMFYADASQFIINNGVSPLISYTNSCVLNDWYYIRIIYDDTTGYKIYLSEDNGNTYTLLGSSSSVDKVDYANGVLDFAYSPVDLRTVRFTYSLDGQLDHLVTCGTTYKAAVWNRAEHATSEADYAFNFIVDYTTESFRLPIYDKVFNSPYADLYYYVGDTAQNTALIDIGRVTGYITDVNNELTNLRALINQISGDIPVIETSTYGYNYVTLYNGTALGDHTIDLSSYIPNDGHQYDVHGYINYRVGDTSGNNRNAYIYNANKSQTLLYMGTDGVTSPSTGDSTFPYTIPLPANSRTIVLTLTGTSDNQFNTFKLYMQWFRKY